MLPSHSYHMSYIQLSYCRIFFVCCFFVTFFLGGVGGVFLAIVSFIFDILDHFINDKSPILTKVLGEFL